MVQYSNSKRQYICHLCVQTFLLLAGVCLPLGSSASSSAVGSFGFDTVSYFTPIHSDRETVFSSVQAKWRGAEIGSKFESVAQAQFILTLNQISYYSFEFPEAYVGTSKRLSDAQLSVGRKLVNWSHLDQRWGLGVWQPSSRWDYLSPETLGLSGAFFSFKTDVFEMVAFGSPLFIPERGAPSEFQGGSIKSFSPWFLNPSDSIQVRGKDTPITYSLNSPSVRDIIAHPGASIMTRVGAKEGLWGSAAYAYKPMNQLLLAFTGFYNHPTRTVDATLYPRVAYHHLTSLEVGYEGRPVAGWISVLHERPVRDETPSVWTTQEVAPSYVLSSSIDVDVAGKAPFATKLDLSYLRHWGGDAPDQGPDRAARSAFDSRYPYQNAVSMGIHTPLDVVFGKWGKNLTASSRFLYDVANDGRILSAEFRYAPKASWVVGVGADILSSDYDRDGEGRSGQDFISRYRSNDRVRGGVTYAF